MTTFQGFTKEFHSFIKTMAIEDNRKILEQMRYFLGDVNKELFPRFNNWCSTKGLNPLCVFFGVKEREVKEIVKGDFKFLNQIETKEGIPNEREADLRVDYED